MVLLMAGNTPSHRRLGYAYPG